MAIGTLGVFAWDLSHGSDIVRDRTMALTVLVMFQLINVFNVRSESRSVLSTGLLYNPLLFLSIMASVAARCVVIYWHPLASVFGLAPLSVHDWMIIIPVAVSIIVVVELKKR